MKKDKDSVNLHDLWEEQKVLVFKDFISRMSCCERTIRRHLKKFNVLSSFNKNGKYYTLPSIANFNSNGLWFYKGISFSKHGSLIDTIIYLISTSTTGLSAKEIFNLINIESYSLLHQLEKKMKLSREKLNGKYIYFSINTDIKNNQVINRQSTVLKITDSIGIIILVIFINNPKISMKELQNELNMQGLYPKLESVLDFFKTHNLLKKTQIFRVV